MYNDLYSTHSAAIRRIGDCSIGKWRDIYSENYVENFNLLKPTGYVMHQQF